MKHISKEHISFVFDPDLPPAERIVSGEIVRFDTKDCYDEQIDIDGKDFTLLDMARNNPVTGPLYVENAAPGDVLKVEILSIEPEDIGVMCVRKGQGVYQVDGCHCRRFPIAGGFVSFDSYAEIPVNPMIGVIGTCPGKPQNTQSPGVHGGNLDIKDLGAGSTIYLPVAVPGALLSLGDCHGLQGDGETAICGMEISAAVTVRVTVLKDAGVLPLPFIDTENAVYTAAADESLDAASIAAAQNMHAYLQAVTDLSDAQAAMLLSLVGNLRISQIVNPKKGCVMEFPKKYLRQTNRRI